MTTMRRQYESSPPVTGRIARWGILLAGLLLTGYAAPTLQAQEPGAGERNQDLTPGQRKELEEQARALHKEAVALYEQQKYPEAIRQGERALALRRKLYPKDQYPQGHDDLGRSLHNLGNFHEALARSLNNLGNFHAAQKEYSKAEPYYRAAVAMQQALYPRDQYPQGHLLLLNQSRYGLGHTLDRLGDLFVQQEEYDKAESYYCDGLTIWRVLYEDKYIHGQGLLAHNLDKFGGFLVDRGAYTRAEPFLREALAIDQAMYPKDKYPQGHLNLASGLMNLGVLLWKQGEYAKAEPFHRAAVDMYRVLPPDMYWQLPPKDRYPMRDKNLARCLHNLGSMLCEQGEYTKAEPYLREALAMKQTLYPKEKYPQGDPDLAPTLNDLGNVLKHKGELTEAEAHLRAAVTMWQALYPKDKYPQGQRNLAVAVSDLGALFWEQGDYDKAEKFGRDALAMQQALYPKNQFPRGHPELALSLMNLGSLLTEKGDYTKAESFCRQAVAMEQALYPQGHRERALSLNHLASLLQKQGAYRKAEPLYRDALVMYQQQADKLAALAPEARALNFAATFPTARHGFLSNSRHLSDSFHKVYPLIWQSKAGLTRVYERRHLALLAAVTAPSIRARWDELLALRRQRERLLLAVAPADRNARDERLRDLDQRIGRSERELQPLLPALARAEQLTQRGAADLQQHLPPRTVFIDLLRYDFSEQVPQMPGTPGARHTLSYVAFVVSAAQVRRVELGPAQPIEVAIAAWRTALNPSPVPPHEAARRELEQKAAAQADILRRLVWEKLAPHLPADTRTIYLAPDAALTQLPWAALPSAKKGSVLLEDYALAVVPHGPFLLDKLTAPLRPSSRPNSLLIVGGVQYDERPAGAPPELLAHRAALRDNDSLHWRFLKGTVQELQQIQHTATAAGRKVQSITGAAASTDRLLQALPRVRYAHLATHGFFADKQFRSLLQLDEQLFARREFGFAAIGERIGEGARSPLVLSGLVLAGANLPAGQLPDRGILTGDAIAGLLLDNLELAVLSACETGLGDVAGGEGVFGLQRAFHLAGTENVIASLWRVDDQATAALMTQFYHYLWQEKLPAIEALQQAQLALYRHPEQIAAWARGERAPDFTTTKAGTAAPPAAPSTGKAPVQQWAAFQLSGLGR